MQPEVSRGQTRSVEVSRVQKRSVEEGTELAHLSTSWSLPCCSSARTTYSSWDRDRCWVARPGLASHTATSSHNSAIISDDAVVMLLRCCGDAPQFLPLVPSQPRLFRVLVRSAAPLRLMSPPSVRHTAAVSRLASATLDYPHTNFSVSADSAENPISNIDNTLTKSQVNVPISISPYSSRSGGANKKITYVEVTNIFMPKIFFN